MEYLHNTIEIFGVVLIVLGVTYGMGGAGAVNKILFKKWLTSEDTTTPNSDPLIHNVIHNANILDRIELSKKMLEVLFSSPNSPPLSVSHIQLSLTGPTVMAAVGVSMAGVFVYAIPTIQCLTISVLTLVAWLCLCYVIAVWQIKNKRW